MIIILEVYWPVVFAVSDLCTLYISGGVLGIGSETDSSRKGNE